MNHTLDCYGNYDENTGCLRIGNDLIEKKIWIRGGSLCTDCITDRETGAEWKSEGPKVWQRCPVLAPDENPEVTVRQQFCLETLPVPYLQTEVELKGRNGTVIYEYRVFSRISFVYSQIFVQAAGKNAYALEKLPEAQPSGIEKCRFGEEERHFCGDDVLDSVPLGRRNLELEAVTIFDQTDRTDSLVERKTVPLSRGYAREEEGSLFRISDYVHGNSLLLVRHAPAPGSALSHSRKDLKICGNGQAELCGTGIDFSALPAGKVPCYASAVGTGRTEEIWSRFRRYSGAFFKGSQDSQLFVMSNTWGDRHADLAVCEKFVMEELECAHRLGITAIQIDDGWQKGITGNSARKAGGRWGGGYYEADADFWAPAPGTFPNGLAPIAEKAREYGIRLGLWFSPDSCREFENVERDMETLWGLYRDYGVCWFKLDGFFIETKLGEMRLLHLMEELSDRSGGQIGFNLDVTTYGRLGYLCDMQYSTLFVENRYTDWGNYFPHNTFRNLWNLASVVPPRRIQMEFLNCRRNPQNYQGAPFPPDSYGMDYLFASVMPANPLAWMELQHLQPEDARVLGQILEKYRIYRGELYHSEVVPIGKAPNGMTFPGYCCRNPGDQSGHLLLFRENTEASSGKFLLPCHLDHAQLEEIYISAPASVTVEADTVSVEFSRPLSVIWLRWALQPGK